jgi:hypothetical protein
MATRDQAKQQYDDYIRGRNGAPNADTEGDFSNLWNQSSEAGMYSGQGYGKGWDELFGAFKPTLDARWNEGPKNATPAQQWNAQPGGGTGAVSQMGGRSDELYKTLMDRVQGGINVNSSDPLVRAQVDPMVAQQERAMRTYIDDTAERSGPLANLQGERRLAAERMGQQAGAFESEVIGRMIEGERGDINQRLQMYGDLLSNDQRLALQRELGYLDDAGRTKDRDLQRYGMGMSNDQFLRQLALQEWNDRNKWDYTWGMGGE